MRTRLAPSAILAACLLAFPAVAAIGLQSIPVPPPPPPLGELEAAAIEPKRPIPETLPTVRVDLREEGFLPGVTNVHPQVIEGYQSLCDEHWELYYNQNNDLQWIPWGGGSYTPGTYTPRVYAHQTPAGTFQLQMHALSYGWETTQPAINDMESPCNGPLFTEAVGIFAVGTFTYTPPPGVPATPMDFQVHFPELLQHPGVQLNNPEDPYVLDGLVWGNAFHPCWYSSEDVHWLGWTPQGPHVDPTGQQTVDRPLFWPIGNRHTSQCDFPLNPAGVEPWAELTTRVPIFVAYLGHHYCAEADNRGNVMFDEDLNVICGPAYIEPQEKAIEFRVLHPASPFAWRFVL
ncbi:MAG TPA: hypothetical protein VFH47_07420 [Candidatus Thermoplasmatota archaeon]|nr:hypothetical protein [Candidatus Thermoplasmatota archaeon]